MADRDYEESKEFITFNAGDVNKTHTITINDDNECEDDPDERFFSLAGAVSGISDITVTVDRANITINDSGEAECGQLAIPCSHTPPHSFLSPSHQMIFVLDMRRRSTPLLKGM